jgi:hypothetical protein
MRKDYRLPDIEPPPSEVRAWLDLTIQQGELLPSSKGLAAPEHVLGWLRGREEIIANWKDGAKDRPVTFDDSNACPRMRLFDGRWLLRRRESIPDALEATCGQDDELYSVVAPIWSTYQVAIEHDDEESCRKLAAAIYAWLDAKNEVDLALVQVALKVCDRYADVR